MGYVVFVYLIIGFFVFAFCYDDKWNVCLAKGFMWPITLIVYLAKGIMQVIDEYLK